MSVSDYVVVSPLAHTLTPRAQIHSMLVYVPAELLIAC